jgi:hypothetical protein
VLGDLLRVLLPNLALTHLFTDSRIELAHLTALTDGVASFTEIL